MQVFAFMMKCSAQLDSPDFMNADPNGCMQASLLEIADAKECSFEVLHLDYGCG
jgi:hypothetical protein